MKLLRLNYFADIELRHGTRTVIANSNNWNDKEVQYYVSKLSWSNHNTMKSNSMMLWYSDTINVDPFSYKVVEQRFWLDFGEMGFGTGVEKVNRTTVAVFSCIYHN